MSPRLPSVSGRQAVRALERAGLVVVRVTGSHHRLVHPSDPARAATVPVHGAKALKKGTLRAIVREAGLTVEEFAGLL